MSSEQQLLAIAGKQNGRRGGVVTQSSTTEEAQKKSHRKEFIQRDYREMKRERTRTKKEPTKVGFQKMEAHKKGTT